MTQSNNFQQLSMIFYCRQLQSVDLFNNELVENRWRKTIDKIDVIINENVSNDIIISDINNFNQLKYIMNIDSIWNMQGLSKN